MIYDGFFERYRKLTIIGAHGGGALPYLVSRMDQCYDNIPACREKIARKPSEYLPQIYADAVVFAPEVLQLCVNVFGAGNVLPEARERARRVGTRQGARRERAPRVQAVMSRL